MVIMKKAASTMIHTSDASNAHGITCTSNLSKCKFVVSNVSNISIVRNVSNTRSLGVWVVMHM